MQEIKLWQLKKNGVVQVKKEKLDYENRLEKWITDDISIISPNLVIIGTQVLTAYKKKIDILAMNPSGDLVIIELKRNKTYREVIAQGLDYATWVKDLDYEDLNLILQKHNQKDYSEIADLYTEAFDKDAEEIEFNSDHKILIVGSEIDDSTKRIIEYLSNEPYSVNINALNFNYFKDKAGQEFIAQSFVTSEENIIEESKSKKRKRAKSIISQLFELDKLKIGQIVVYQPAVDKGVSIENIKIKAKIIKKGGNCLQREGEIETYSFSKLRRIIVDENNLTEIRKFWGFGIRNEWVTEEGTKLIDLIE